MRPVRLSIMTTVLACFAVACAGMQTQKSVEPSTIIIRNTTSVFVNEVYIRAADKDNEPFRYGKISPLPAGVSQIVGRPTNPPKLKNSVIICWEPENGDSICRTVDLGRILKTNRDHKSALVFEIAPHHQVKAYLESGQR